MITNQKPKCNYRYRSRGQQALRSKLWLLLPFLILLANLQDAHAQDPCLAGWNYRVPVTIDNAGASALTEYQVLVEVNTSDLIVNGKMQLDGGDIRFLTASEEVLPYWIEDGTMNTTSTRIWVKVNSLPASTATDIFMFYGSPSAPNLSNGDDTFELFDGFDDIAVNPDKWDVCGDGTVTVANGQLTISSTHTPDEKYFLTADDPINSPVIIESDVISIDNGQTIMGLINAADDGFGINYEISGQPQVLMREINDDGAGCYVLDDVQDPVNQDALSANVTEGIWRFAWFSGNEQDFDWPGNGDPDPLERAEDEHTLPASYRPVFGHFNQGDLDGPGTEAAGEVVLNWLRVRKYTDQEPTFALGTETVIINEVTASAASETICEGQTIELFAEALPGANFSWTGPDGFSSTDQNPTITNATVAASGIYTVEATVPSTCFLVSDQVTITVEAATVPGTTDGAATVCTGANNGTITLTGNTGDVVRWESSASGSAPWTAIDVTTTTLDYENLLETTHYRAVVQNGFCDPAFTNIIEITVDQEVIPGNVLGAASGCIGQNTGVLRLNDFSGSVARWQSKAESATTWTDINTTRDTLVYENLTETTQFRAFVESGTCGELPSAPATITIYPLPQPAFTAAAVCEGNETAFSNQSTIAVGNIDSYVWNFDNGSSSVLRSPTITYEEAGTYDVRLTATSDQGCENSVVNQVTVKPLPKVDFFTENVCQENPIDITPITSIATGSIRRYQWDFGDGNDDTFFDDDPFAYEYDTAGTYTVNLNAISIENCERAVAKEVTIYPRASLRFTADPVFEGDETSFFNNSSIEEGNLTYQWSFGDGANSTAINPQHFYEEAGTYVVQLISRSGFGGCRDTIQQDYTVVPQVLAAFEVAPVCQDFPAEFINQSMVKAGSLSYLWDFGDGVTSTAENPSHQYRLPGDYRVRLTATSEEGSIDITERIVSIYPEPVADFDFDPQCDEELVTFKNLSRVQEGQLEYNWFFADDTESDEISPKHLYPEAGSYNTRLIATTGYGCRDTVIYPVTIHPLPEPLFTVDTVCFGETSILENLSTVSQGSISKYLWDLGDGTNSINENPLKDYEAPGTYEITVEATTDKGCVATYSSTAHVVQLPVADFSVQGVCFRETSVFVNRSVTTEGELSYVWDFADGNVSSTTEPEHTYALPGNFEVQLTATSVFGCQDSISQVAEVYELPALNISSDTTVSRGFPAPLFVTGAQSYFWSPATGLDNQNIASPTARLIANQDYTVIGIDENGCESQTGVSVGVVDDFIVEPANVITPDGNLINDTWFVENIDAYAEAEITVFNLWGDQVFRTSGYQNDWDGTFRSDALPAGNYYYTITSPNHEKVYRGTITLLRVR